VQDRTKIRLRFDKVALRFVADLQRALHDAVPEGHTVLITIGAPIRQSVKTAALLAVKTLGRLSRRVGRWELAETIHENRIRVRLVDAGSSTTANVAGFVHNPDNDAGAILDAAESELRARARKV